MLSLVSPGATSVSGVELRDDTASTRGRAPVLAPERTGDETGACPGTRRQGVTDSIVSTGDTLIRTSWQIGRARSDFFPQVERFDYSARHCEKDSCCNEMDTKRWSRGDSEVAVWRVADC